MIEILAILACVVLAGFTVFQIALIFGAPLGKYAWGGKHTVLPTNLRVGSAVSVILYIIFAIIILSKVEIITLLKNQAVIDVGIWVLAVYFCIGTLMNAISRSKSERNVMTPAALILALTTIFIAMN